MEALWIALGKIGGLAAVGGLIDLGMRKAEKERLTDWLMKWWDRFDSVKWSNFGQKEAEAAVLLIDRCAGRRFFTWRRWLFVLPTVVVAFMAAISWATYCMGQILPAASPVAPTWRQTFLIALGEPLQLFSLVLAFGLSISATRTVSVVVASFATGPIRTVLFFCALLLLQALLFVFWTRTVWPLLVAVVQVVAATLLGTMSADDVLRLGPDFLLEELNRVSITERVQASFHFFSSPESQKPLVMHYLSTAPPADQANAIRYVATSNFYQTFSGILDIVANGARVVFALVFLSSFVFRPLIQAPISRLWAGMIESGKPIFATLLGAVGAVIVMAQALLN